MYLFEAAGRATHLLPRRSDPSGTDRYPRFRPSTTASRKCAIVRRHRLVRSALWAGHMARPLARDPGSGYFTRLHGVGGAEAGAAPLPLRASLSALSAGSVSFKAPSGNFPLVVCAAKMNKAWE